MAVSYDSSLFTQTITLTLPSKPHVRQDQIIRNARRFNVLDAGRRFGKDVLLIDRAIDMAALKQQPVAWFAPTYKMLLENWRTLKDALYPVVTKSNEQEKRLDLITGGIVDMWSLEEPDAGRGRKYARVIINEAAMARHLEYAWKNVIRPTLADLRGDAWFGSTPKGLNYFYSLYLRGLEDPEWTSWQFTTYDNPYIARVEIDAMKSELPERVFRQEIMAEFIEDGGYFQNVNACAVIEQPDEPEQHAGHYLVMGGDLAISEDYTVLAVACRNCNRVVDWRRFNQIAFGYQRERIVELATRWNAGALIERNSIGVPNLELLRDRIRLLNGPDNAPGYNTTATTKPPLINGLAAALEHHNFLVPKEAAEELRAYQVETLESGHPRFGAPEGLHDDFVIALALAWYAMTNVQWLIT